MRLVSIPQIDLAGASGRCTCGRHRGIVIIIGIGNWEFHNGLGLDCTCNGISELHAHAQRLDQNDSRPRISMRQIVAD
eukprot:scaffold570922_cov47-Prasinocladus_malaysianus.AAC.3